MTAVGPHADAEEHDVGDADSARRADAPSLPATSTAPSAAVDEESGAPLTAATIELLAETYSRQIGVLRRINVVGGAALVGALLVVGADVRTVLATATAAVLLCAFEFAVLQALLRARARDFDVDGPTTFEVSQRFDAAMLSGRLRRRRHEERIAVLQDAAADLVGARRA